MRVRGFSHTNTNAHAQLGYVEEMIWDLEAPGL
jgi:hypothetical protein